MATCLVLAPGGHVGTHGGDRDRDPLGVSTLGVLNAVCRAWGARPFVATIIVAMNGLVAALFA